MRDFSQLLDALVYTRSRNAKLKLIGDYLRAHARSRSRLGAGGADRRARPAGGEAGRDPRDRRGAGRSGAVRDEPRLCRRHGRDGRLCSGPAPDGSPPSSTTARLRLSQRGRAARLPWRAPRRRRALAAMLDHLDVGGRFALLKLATGALRIGVSARLAKTALANAFGLDVDAVEEVWHGIGPPYAALFAWAEGAAPQPTAGDVPVFRPFMLAHPLEEARGRRSTIMPPNGNGTASASSSSTPAARPGSTAAPATTSPAAFPTSPRRSRRRGRARRRIAGARARRRAARRGAASFNALQQRLGRKIVSAKMLGDYPAFVRLYDILFDGPEDLRALPLDRAPRRGSRPSSPASIPTRFDLSRADRGGGFRRARAKSAPAPATPRSRA